MKLLVSVLFAVFALSHQLLAKLLGEENDERGRVFGGRFAKQNEFPWMVNLEIEDGEDVSTCGGTIISKNYVLTAAHCVCFNSSLEIYADLNNVRGKIGNINENDAISVEFTEMIVHEEYDDRDNSADVALLKFEVPLAKYNKSISNICLADKGRKYPNRQPVIQMGWGRFDNGSVITSDILKTTERGYLLDFNSCKKEMHSSPAPGELCVSNLSGEKICGGDSGGPLVIINGAEKVDIGIVSYDHYDWCVEGNYYPSFYMDISYYSEWIKDSTGNDKGICWK